MNVFINDLWTAFLGIAHWSFGFIFISPYNFSDGGLGYLGDKTLFIANLDLGWNCFDVFGYHQKTISSKALAPYLLYLFLYISIFLWISIFLLYPYLAVCIPFYSVHFSGSVSSGPKIFLNQQ